MGFWVRRHNSQSGAVRISRSRRLVAQLLFAYTEISLPFFSPVQDAWVRDKWRWCPTQFHLHLDLVVNGRARNEWMRELVMASYDRDDVVLMGATTTSMFGTDNQQRSVDIVSVLLTPCSLRWLFEFWTSTTFLTQLRCLRYVWWTSERASAFPRIISSRA